MSARCREGDNMSDTTVNADSVKSADEAPKEAPAEAVEAPAKGEAPAEDVQLGEGGLKALQAERDARKAAEARVKEYEDRVREYEDRDKTEQQKAIEQVERLNADLEAARASLAQSELTRARTEVAYAKGVPADLAERLRGETREELEADAEALMALIPKPAEEPVVRRPKPVENLGNGGGGNLSPAEQFAEIMSRTL